MTKKTPRETFIHWITNGAVSHIDFGPQSHELLRVPEVAKMLGCSQESVRSLIDLGKLEAHDMRIGNVSKPSWRVRRRSVVLFLAESANYDPSEFLHRVAEMLRFLNKSQLEHIADQAKRLSGQA